MLGHQRLRHHLTTLRGQSFFFYDVFQGVVHQGQIGIHALEPTVLVLQFTQLGQVRFDAGLSQAPRRERMVVVLPADRYDAWLNATADEISAFLRPFVAEEVLAESHPTHSSHWQLW